MVMQILASASVRVLSSLEGGKPTARLDIVVPVLQALGLEVTDTGASRPTQPSVPVSTGSTPGVDLPVPRALPVP